MAFLLKVRFTFVVIKNKSSFLFFFIAYGRYSVSAA